MPTMKPSKNRHLTTTDVTRTSLIATIRLLSPFGVRGCGDLQIRYVSLHQPLCGCPVKVRRYEFISMMGVYGITTRTRRYGTLI